jgi:dihydrolipoamide dehydrogenase
MAKKIVIMGGGPGGVAAAIRARQLGAEAALVELGDLGGVCMNAGCIPLRILGSCREAASAAEGAAPLGLQPSVLSLNVKGLEKRVQQTAEHMRLGTRSLLRAKGVEVLAGEARLLGPGRVRVERKTLTADAVILATGGGWSAPGFTGADLDGIRPPDLLSDVTDSGRRVLLTADSDWAVELAAFYARFGRTTILATPKEFMSRFDRAVRVRLGNALKKEGVEVLRRTEIHSVRKTDQGLEVSLRAKGRSEKRTVDRVLFTGRAPRIDGAGLKEAGVDLREGAVAVNDRLQTNLPGVYAIGDLTGPPCYSHKASCQGELAAENALGGKRSFEDRLLPSVLYSRPEAAAVGLTEKAAKAEHEEVIVGEVPYGFNPRAMAEMEESGVVRALFEGRHGQLLGVHVLGPHSAELITQAALALQLEATAEELADLIAPHPTFAESLVDAARMALGRAMYLPG